MLETATVSKGDVTIRLASTGEQATTSSKLLPLTSLVFEAMLCPNFAEGAQLEKTGTIEITLDSHPEALIVLKVIHHRSDAIPYFTG
jgi:hypothetical protein